MLKWLAKKLLLLNPQSAKTVAGGYTRLGFSEEEQLAMQSFIETAKELDLIIEEDAIGNVIATLPGKNEQAPAIAFGSHLDTVINGGAYDGVAGILAGLGVIKKIKQIGYQSNFAINVICFISEESARFGVATIGSKAMTGLLSVDKVRELTDQDNITFEEALKELDRCFSDIKKMNWQDKNIHSFVELHTEQGPQLHNLCKKVGIVTGIASPLRYKIMLKGEASHTGTTPMIQRSDALATAAELISFVEKLGIDYSKKDHFVSTVSMVKNYPNSMNVIPGMVEIGVDIRSIDKSLTNQYKEQLYEYCSKLSKNRNVSIKLNEISNENPVLMDQTVIQRLKRSSKALNMPYIEMISGAGHDAMNMAQRWPSGMVFIPCNGMSHNPYEYTDMSNILNGIEILFQYIKEINREAEDEH